MQFSSFSLRYINNLWHRAVRSPLFTSLSSRCLVFNKTVAASRTLSTGPFCSIRRTPTPEPSPLNAHRCFSQFHLFFAPWILPVPPGSVGYKLMMLPDAEAFPEQGVLSAPCARRHLAFGNPAAWIITSLAPKLWRQRPRAAYSFSLRPLRSSRYLG